MNGNQEQDFLGDYANQGCTLKEYDDHILTVNYKGVEIAAFNQTTVTKEAVQAVLKRYFGQLERLAEVAQ